MSNILKISDENIIDTEKKENIEKYKTNIQELIKETKENRKINKFVIIRNDDFIPENYTWTINLNGEYKTLLTYNEGTTKKNKFSIFSKTQKTEMNLKQIKVLIGQEFRSTKHFTINTPLKLTEEYNTVKNDRPFTIIDDINNFLNSGYAYSLSEKDAYLDITHEGLKISENATILISQENYEKIKNNKELLSKLSKRNLIIYKGNQALAINMFLSENGILPFRTEMNAYDEETKQIIDNSLKQICNLYNIEYNRPHGYNGHFTSIIDQYENNGLNEINQLIQYLNNKYPEYIIKGQPNNKNWLEYMNTIGKTNFVNAIEEFNKNNELRLQQKKSLYINQHKEIPKEIKEIFRETFELIKINEQNISFQNETNELTKNIVKFFISKNIQEQIEASIKIKEIINNYYNEDNKKTNQK